MPRALAYHGFFKHRWLRWAQIQRQRTRNRELIFSHKEHKDHRRKGDPLSLMVTWIPCPLIDCQILSSIFNSGRSRSWMAEHYTEFWRQYASAPCPSPLSVKSVVKARFLVRGHPARRDATIRRLIRVPFVLTRMGHPIRFPPEGAGGIDIAFVIDPGNTKAKKF